MTSEVELYTGEKQILGIYEKWILHVIDSTITYVEIPPYYGRYSMCPSEMTESR